MSLPFHIMLLASLGLIQVKQKQRQPKMQSSSLPIGYELQKINQSKKKIKIPFVSLIIILIPLTIGVLIWINISDNPSHQTPIQENKIQLPNDAIPYEQIVSKWSSKYVEKLQPQRQAIEAANCDLLEEQYRVNTGWELRPYVKYRMMQLNC